MLYYIFKYLDEAYNLPGSGMFQYISFRAAASIILALLIVIIFGRKIIDFLRRKQIGEEVRDLGLEGQLQKRGTPTMGGVIILLAILVPILLLGRLDNIYIQLMIVSTVWLGLIGGLDDYIKVFRHNKEGLKGRFKIVGQVGLGIIVGTTMCLSQEIVVRDKIVQPVQTVYMNEDGSVKGVKAVRGADTLMIYADSVVITTGGYAYNPELTVRLDPEKAGTMGIGFPGSTGEGIMMASNVGAALTHTGDMMCVLKDYEIMAEHDGTSATANVSSFISRDNTVLVGANGKRFVDEKDSGYMTQKLNGPVFDQMHRDGLGYVWAISDQASLDEKGVKRGLDMEFVVADTFEELAEKMGLDAATLSETLTNYNAYCDAGHDPEFGRLKLAKLNAPYCAVRVTPCEIITYGGIARNENAEVIRADGAVIPGLYTAGEATASSAYMGFTISNAFTWGRIAGSGAAAFALAK